MKKKLYDSKPNLAIVASLFLLMILGCQPEQGKLTVLPSEGVEIITSKNQNYTAQIKNDDLILKVDGSWEGSVGVNLNVENISSKELILKFGEMSLVNGKKENSTVGGIIETKNGSFNTIREARVNGKENDEKAPEIKIKAKENRQFSIAFSKPFKSVKDTEEERTLYFTLPIKMINTTATPRELKIVFKATE
jgi:hypothetical protein